MRRPSGENAAADRAMAGDQANSLAVVASQMRAVVSSEAVTMRCPSGENAADGLDPVARKDGNRLPLDASQMRAVLSPEAVTMRCPSGENRRLQKSLMPGDQGHLFAAGCVPDARGHVQ